MLTPGEREGLKPCFGGVRRCVAEVVCELPSTAFQLFKHAFESIPILVIDMVESEPELEQGGFEPGYAIDEKHGGFDVMFLADFCQELFCQHGRSGAKEFDVQEFVRAGLNSGVQPVALVIELNHGFVEYDVIWLLAGVGL